MGTPRRVTSKTTILSIVFSDRAHFRYTHLNQPEPLWKTDFLKTDLLHIKTPTCRKIWLAMLRAGYKLPKHDLENDLPKL